MVFTIYAEYKNKPNKGRIKEFYILLFFYGAYTNLTFFKLYYLKLFIFFRNILTYEQRGNE